VVIGNELCWLYRLQDISLLYTFLPSWHWAILLKFCTQKQLFLLAPHLYASIAVLTLKANLSEYRALPRRGFELDSAGKGFFLTKGLSSRLCRSVSWQASLHLSHFFALHPSNHSWKCADRNSHYVIIHFWQRHSCCKACQACCKPCARLLQSRPHFTRFWIGPPESWCILR
jgi:hypothetical protein